MDNETMDNDNEDQQPDREPPVATTSYHTNPFLTDQEKHSEGKRAFDSEQDTAETDEGGE